MTDADLIWNRAAMEDGGSNPSAGDRALASLLYAHGLAMNGGVLHAAECLESSELSAAQSGYRYFDLSPVADLLSRARAAFDADDELESQEPLLDLEYATLIPDDSFLVHPLSTTPYFAIRTIFHRCNGCQQCVAAELRHPCRKRLSCSSTQATLVQSSDQASVSRFGVERRRPHFPLGEQAKLTMSIPESGR